MTLKGDAKTMNETNWNNVEKHYREKCEEIKQILNTIPLNAQMRTQSKLVINKNLEPVVILFCDFIKRKNCRSRALHSFIAKHTARVQTLRKSCYFEPSEQRSLAVSYQKSYAV